MANLLRQHHIQLDRDILSSEIAQTLANGTGIPISPGEARIYSLELKPGTTVAGSEVRSLGLDKMNVLIVGIVRGEHEIIPHGGTVLQVGDSLLVTSARDAIQEFEAMIAVPANQGGTQEAQEKSDGAGL